MELLDGQVVLICDLHRECVLRKDMAWQPLPISRDDLPELVQFAVFKEASRYAIGKSLGADHLPCRPTPWPCPVD